MTSGAPCQLCTRPTQDDAHAALDRADALLSMPGGARDHER